MPYSDLTTGEQAAWNEYQTLRAISDWDGFDAAQAKRKEEARAWLVERRKEIWRQAQPKPKGDGRGWKVNNRRERHTFLRDDNLNAGAPKHEVRLPCPGKATAAEKVFIEEREGYLAFATTTPEQKQRKLDNLAWLVARRKQLYRLMKDDAANNERHKRQDRYDALCIATSHGKVYDRWKKTHNKWGVPHTTTDEGSRGRAFCVQHAKSFVGTTESPAGSNKGRHINGWQKRVLGIDVSQREKGFAWCACFTTCMAWDAGVDGSATAGVWNNIEMAKRGQGMYRGFTTDPKKARPGDHVAIGCSSCHIELVAKQPTSSGCDTVGGNTSSGPGGSQFNGGGVFNRHRTRGEIVGYLLVRFDN